MYIDENIGILLLFAVFVFGFQGKKGITQIMRGIRSILRGIVTVGKPVLLLLGIVVLLYLFGFISF